jgi:hypothetical protein
MQLLGASTTAPATGLDPQPGVTNYFLGNDPQKWHTGIPTYGKVNYAGIYPGIDLVFYGNQRQLEYDFVLSPGSDPARIAWSFRGTRPRLDQDGSLELDETGGTVQFLAPVAYQIIAGERRPVSVTYAVVDETVHFALGQYDHSQTLIIDPVLSYFSYLGGTGNDYIGNSAPQGYGSPSPEPTQSAGIDAQGNLYVAGSTTSTDFPIAGALLPITTKQTSESWAFVSKFSPDGSKLLDSTYIGGSTGGNDAAYALAVDSAGNGNYSQNAFALKLNPTGTTLVYSSFLGGYGAAWGTGIAVDGTGRAYLTGGLPPVHCAAAACIPTVPNTNAFPPRPTRSSRILAAGTPSIWHL